MTPTEAVLALLMVAGLAQAGTTNGSKADDSSKSSNSSSSDNLSDKAVLIFFLSALGLTLIVLLINWIWRRWYKIQKRKQALEKYRARYRVSKVDTISQEEYEEHLNTLKRLLEDVKIRTKIYSFTSGQYNVIAREVIFGSFTVKMRDDFDAQVTIRASDYRGSWEGKGGFILTEAGPFFWMIKWYDQESYIRGTDTRVFESTLFSSEGAEGRWFPEEKPRQYSYSARWSITPTPIVGGPN